MKTTKIKIRYIYRNVVNPQIKRKLKDQLTKKRN